MALAPGTRLGAYDIVALIGSGGMGEVYRARDSRLNRDVAIKVLPADVAADHDRLARFEREAQVLASLNHPNIANIYGVDDSSGTPGLVMELVEGPTLADRIAKGPIPLDEALPIAKLIAEALEAAHEQGIIHRDLKPANIKVRADGTAKVLDFGLAKALDPVASVLGNATMSPTLSMHATHAGIILGTAAYMSPEQARGKAVDRRADTWAFGCVLYEMLSGRRAFEGDDLSIMLASVLRSEPDWRALPADVPAAIRRLLSRCLQKDPTQRCQAIGDARIDIADVLRGPTRSVDPALEGVRPRPSRPLRALVASALSFAVALALWTAWRPASSPPMLRLDVTTPPTIEPFSFAISPDGRQLVFVASNQKTSQLFLRPLDRVAAEPLTGTENATYPFWSPDGRAIAFFAEGKLKRLDLSGGAPHVLANAPNGRGGTWNGDGTIVFSPTITGGLWQVSATGGPTSELIRTGGQYSIRWPHFLPDGRHLLFTAMLGQADTRGVYVGSLDGRRPTRILSIEAEADYTAGNLFFVDQGTLLARPFDPARAALTGEPVPIAQMVGGDSALGHAGFSTSNAGVLAYRSGTAIQRQIGWVDRVGHVLDVVVAPDASPLSNVELAPDARQFAFNRNTKGNGDVWLLDVSTRIERRLTSDPALEVGPVWSPGGDRVVFRSSRNGKYDLFEKQANGATDERPLLVTDQDKAPQDWSHDGKILLYASQDATTQSDLWALPLDGDSKPFPVARTDFDEVHGQISPDGHWLAYASNETGKYEVYIQAFPKASGKQPVSTGGGVYPRWRHDGRELYYATPDNRLVAVPVQSSADGSALNAGKPLVLFNTRMSLAGLVGIAGALSKAQYAVAPDGRFLMVLNAEDTPLVPINVVVNWAGTLRR
jgi:serine/threonine protein kinase